MSFHDVQFPTDISWGAVGGPLFSTDVITVDSGREARNANWSASLGKWNVAHAIKAQTQLDALLAFFRARQGRAHSFRFRDWTDYAAVNQVLGQTGAATVQLRKVYTSGPTTVYRDITKPIAGITMRRGGGAFSAFTLDAATGIVTLTADSSKAISNITAANPAVVTATAHGFSNGNTIYLSGVLGMTQINGQVGVITVLTADTFSIAINASAYSAYTSGGTAAKHVQPSETLDWSGSFDCHCRFDADEMPATINAPGVFTWGEINVRELRD